MQTPLAGISIGRGYSRIAGEDYFRGLAVELPFGKLRVGWRIWSRSEDESPEPDNSRNWKRAIGPVFRHFLTFFYVLVIITLFDAVIGPGDFFVGWVAAIWGAVLVSHFIERVAIEWLADRLLPVR